MATMKLVMYLELMTDWGDVTQVGIEKLKRAAGQLQADAFGLCLPDGRRVLDRTKQDVVQLQTCEHCQVHRICTRCHRWNPDKDYRQRKLDAVFAGVRTGGPHHPLLQ